MSYEGLAQALTSVTRLAKTILPDNVLIQTEVKNALARSSSLFMLHLILAAEQFRQTTKRTTISSDDILKALHEVDFPELSAAMEIHLGTIRKIATAKRMKKKSKPVVDSVQTEIEDEVENDSQPQVHTLVTNSSQVENQETLSNEKRPASSLDVENNTDDPQATKRIKLVHDDEHIENNDVESEKDVYVNLSIQNQ